MQAIRLKKTAREKNLEDEHKTTSCILILSNGKKKKKKAHDIYRKKDVVEKAFMKYKN
jgi:hypothetical protein